MSTVTLPVGGRQHECPTTWQRAWRYGIVPQLTTEGLEALRLALIEDDPALIQGASMSPPPLQCVADRRVCAACAIGMALWQRDPAWTVGALEQKFAILCSRADRLLSEAFGCRWFLNWYDDMPRDEMRRELLAEVNRNLADRYADGAADAQPAEWEPFAASL